MLNIVSSMFHSEGSLNSAKKISFYGHFVLPTITHLYERAGAQEGACQARSAEEAGPGRLGGAGAVPRESGWVGRGAGPQAAAA